MVYPDYQRVDNPDVNKFFEKFWETKLDKNPGLTVVEIMDEITKGVIKGLYVMGENPAMSDPDLNHARKALSKLEHLVVQDIFLTETAMYADIILPASAFPEKTGTFTNTDRRVQLGNQAVKPPGKAKQDLWIIQEIARGLGLYWNYTHPKEVFDEMTKCMPSIKGITWERLEESHSITYPCDDSNDPGQPVIFIDEFPTESGKAKFVKSPLINAAELPDDVYPFVLITGRQLEHWHTGSMTRRASMLHEIEPDPNANLCFEDMQKFNIQDGDLITVESRRGSIDVYARRDDMLKPGQVFIPFCYVESAANLLTNAALDPFAKIPEFKFCAVNIKKSNKTLSLHKKTLNEYLEQLKIYVQRQDYAESVGLLNNAISHYPEEDKLKLNLGNIYKLLDQKDDALSIFSMLKNSELADLSNNNLSLIYLEQGNLDKAIEHAKIALDINPNYLDAKFNLALALFESKNYENSLLLLDQLIEIDNYKSRAFELKIRIQQIICDWSTYSTTKRY